MCHREDQLMMERDIRQFHTSEDHVEETGFESIPLERCPDMPNVTIMRTKGHTEMAYLALGYEVSGSHKVCSLLFRIAEQRWQA